MNEGFKIWFKAIPEGWKFFGAVVGFATLISVGTIKVYNWKNKDKAQGDVIVHLQKSDSLNSIRWNDLYNRIDGISDSLNANYRKTNNLTNNYVEFAKKNSATVDDFVNAVNGLEVVMTQTNEKSMDKPQFKMIIQKKQK